MKKKLFLALLTTLLLLLAATTALAVSPSDFNCIKCGEPCTEWYASISNDGTTNNHSPLCRTCWAIVWDAKFPCTPVEGTATCIQADLCSVCGYPDNINSAPNPNAHNMRSWSIYSSTQHHRYCQNCYAKDTYEYEDHYGGTATCVMQAVCEGCGEPYGELDNTRHGNNYSSWDYHSAAQHERCCLDCGGIAEYEDHYGGTATCIDLAICEGCGTGYGEPSTKHAMSGWVSVSPTRHRKNCTLCWSPETIFYEDHYGGTATCIAPAVCEGCDASYGDPIPDAHMWSEWTPGASGTHYRTCGLNSEHIEYGDCPGDWFWLNDKEHGSFCSTCKNRQVAEHTGGTATCSQPAICEVCSEPYGEPDSSGLTGHPNPTIEVKPGTCYDEGYYRITCDEPGCTMPFYEIATPANGQHIYNDWQPLGDGSHIAACHFCQEELTVPCTAFTAELFAACPICGEYEGGVLPVVCAHDDDESLPYGTLVIRGGEIPADGAMCAITVAGSYGGQVVELIAPVTVSLPMELTGFRVIDMNGEEIPFTLENGVLTFETATAGLFLLVPAE